MSVLTAPPRSATATDTRYVLPSRLDGTTVEVVRLQLVDVLQGMDRRAGDLVLDCSSLEVVDAAGLGFIMGLHRRAHDEGRRLVLADPPARVLRLLAVTRLHRVLHVERETIKV